MTDLQQFIPGTVELALSALSFAVVFGVPLGIVAALAERPVADHLAGSSPLLARRFPSSGSGCSCYTSFSTNCSGCPVPVG
jgi:ABC-type dipeptide/oligopeptide/nickel transport system permease component